jgi:hypothetical protein
MKERQETKNCSLASATLGRKIYSSINQETEAKINETTSLFAEKIGPASAKFVELLLKEDKPPYQGETQNQVNDFILFQTRRFNEIAVTEPLRIYDAVTLRIGLLQKEIEKAKLEGAAKGYSEPNNPRLRELGVALVLCTCAMKEIVE